LTRLPDWRRPSHVTVSHRLIVIVWHFCHHPLLSEHASGLLDAFIETFAIRFGIATFEKVALIVNRGDFRVYMFGIFIAGECVNPNHENSTAVV